MDCFTAFAMMSGRDRLLHALVKTTKGAWLVSGVALVKMAKLSGGEEVIIVMASFA